MDERKKQKMILAMLEVVKRKATETYVKFAITGEVSTRNLDFINLTIEDLKNELRKGW